MLEILTPKEAADMLKVSLCKLARMSRDGRIPGSAKIGGEWRYTKEGVALLFRDSQTNCRKTKGN